MLNREDVERITQLVLKQLKIEIIEQTRYKRTIYLKLGDEVLTQADLNITPETVFYR
jgi:hypothetical protein